MRKSISLCLFALFSLSTYTGLRAQVQEQGIPSDGRDYYIGYFQPSITCQATKPFQGVYALVSSYYDCNVTFSYFDEQGNEFQAAAVHVQAKHFLQQILDLSHMTLANPEGEVPEYKSCHIHADHPISVQYYSTGPNSGGMYLGLQTGALGTSYMVASLPANPGFGAPPNYRHFFCVTDSSSSEFMVLAIKNETHVTITPNGRTMHGRIGVNSGTGADGTPHPFVVLLQRGQVYMVKSTNDDPDNDMSGSTVTSDQPVAVIAGNEGAFNGYGKNFGVGEQRDLSIEQMVPVDYWTTNGYVSMPFVDSPVPDANDESVGDLYKVYTIDPTGTNVDFSITGVGTKQMQVGLYQNPPASQGNVEDAIEVNSRDGKKIFVEQYDYREMNSTEPFPAPSSMNVVPITRYRKSFMWAVPDDKNQVHKKRYVNVIARRDQFAKIKVWTNGIGPKPITSLASAGTNTIPNHPELQGRRFEIFPGAYYAQGDSAFAVYQYGFLGLDPDFDLGDNDDDDYYFTYASTCGQSFGIDATHPPLIKVDTNCSGWHITIKDADPANHGISQVDLLKDASGVLKRKPNSDSGYVSTNVDFNPVDYTVIPGDTVAVTDIIVDDPLQNAEAWLWAVNGSGKDTLIHLLYFAPSLSLKPDSLNLANVQLGADTCVRFVFKNTGKAGDRSFDAKDAMIQLGNQGFSVGNFSPKLSTTLKPGDSVTFDVCFNPPSAGKLYRDTLIFEYECSKIRKPVSGIASYPLIFATDYDFGDVPVGDTVCHTVNVKNVGKADLVLDKNWMLEDNISFHFADSTLLPVTLQPGKSRDFTFCFTPHNPGADSTAQHWGNNVPFAHQIKDYSALKGNGIIPDLVWDRKHQDILTTCDTEQVVRVYLTNPTSAPTGQSILVDSIGFTGPDIAEFSIPNNIFGYDPLGANVLKPGANLWVDVKFTPNLSGPNPWRDRIDTLWAYDHDRKIMPFIVWDAKVIHADIATSVNAVDLGGVGPGVTTQPKTFNVLNPGTATLIVHSVSVDNPAFTIMPSSLKAGDSIAAGATATVTITGVSSAFGTVTGNLQITGESSCPPKPIVALQFAVSNIAVAATGNDFHDLYICQNLTGQVTVTSTGFRQAKLVKAEILDDPLTPGQGMDFNFVRSGSQALTLDTALVSNTQTPLKLDVNYHPSVKANEQAIIRYTFDTLDNPGKGQWTIDQTLTGTGLQEHQTISAASANGLPYVAKTADNFVVPIRLQEVLTSRADVKTITFDFTYRRDLFVLDDTKPVKDVGNYQVVSVSPESVNGTLATRTITVAPVNGTFTAADEIADVAMELVVSKDTNSTFTISNVKLQDSRGADICYVLHDVIPANFTPSDLCGDSLLRYFMRTNQISFDIAQLGPNPAVVSAHVRVDVHEKDVPLTVELFNMLGKKVRTYAYKEIVRQGHYSGTLNYDGLPSGPYTLRVSSPNQVETAKVLISK